MPEVVTEQPMDEDVAPDEGWWHKGNVERATQAATRQREQLQRDQARASHRADVEAFHSLARTRWNDALKKGKADQAQVWYEAGRAIADGQWLDHRVVNTDPGIKRFQSLRQSLDEVLTESDYKVHQAEGKAFLAHAGKRFEQALKDDDDEAAEAWSAAARAVVDGEWVHSEIVNADPAITAFQGLKARLMVSPAHQVPERPEEQPSPQHRVPPPIVMVSRTRNPG